MQSLTKEERARVVDSKHNIQAASQSLSGVDPRKVPKMNELEECLENADKTLRGVLQASGPSKVRGR
jgi:hypothetical protein